MKKVKSIILVLVTILLVVASSCENTFTSENIISDDTVGIGCSKWHEYKNAPDLIWSQIPNSGSNFRAVIVNNTDSTETTQLWYQNRLLYTNTYNLYWRRDQIWGWAKLEISTVVIGRQSYDIIVWRSVVNDCNERINLPNRDFVLLLNQDTKVISSIFKGRDRDKIFKYPRQSSNDYLLMHSFEHCWTFPYFHIMQYDGSLCFFDGNFINCP